MIVFVAGATGFIGRHLVDALLAEGHHVIGTSRDRQRAQQRRPDCRWVEADFARDVQAAAWLPRLGGVDVVVNAVGILREHSGLSLEAVHAAAPRALFDACTRAGVRRIVQISALGADEHARSGYHLSKKAADDFLAGLPLAWVIVQPSLVYGPGGESARLFETMASLPVIPVPGQGEQQVQPIHVDDAVAAVVALIGNGTFDGSEALGNGTFDRRRVALVGPQPVSMRQFLGGLRQALGLGPARFVGVPIAAMRLVARASRHLPGALLDLETLDMLERGNTASAADTRALLGHAPRTVERFVDARRAEASRLTARLRWLLPLVRLSIALLWIVTGIVSVAVYPVQESYALLERVGVPPALAPLMLYGAGLLDLALGVATLLPVRPRALWLAQIALVLGYTAIITWRLPEFWMHPYGPILKNLPVLAALWLLLELDERPGRR